jgi:folate-binding protein YgfZ
MSIFLEELRTKKSVFKLANSVVKIAGTDAEQYLHSQTTNNVKHLKKNEFHFNTILDLSGKLISSFILLKISPKEFYLVSPDSFVTDTIERVEKFHIAEEFDVSIEPLKAYLRTNSGDGEFKGTYFFESDEIFFSKKEVITNSEENFKRLRVVTGVSQLGLEINQGDLINGTILETLAVDFAKGCYPGQETVSKIHTRRGAALSPVLLISSVKPEISDLIKDEKKIGKILSVVEIDRDFYSYCLINRENRIANLTFEASSLDAKIEFKLRYFPFVNPCKTSLSLDFYDYAVELFYNDINDEALNYFQKAIKFNPSFEDAYESLGVLYGRMEQFDLAIESMEKLKTINPKCMMAYTNLSLYHMKVGNIEIAEDFKSQATFLNFELLGDEAEVKRKEKEVADKKLAERDRREGMFLQVLEMDSQDSMANNGMGEIELERGEHKKAKSYFQSAINGNSKYSVAYLGLAKCLYHLEEKDELRMTLKKGIETASKNGDLMPANEMQTILNRVN